MRVVRFLLLGLIAAGALGVSPFLSWVDGEAATSISFRDLFGITGDSAGLFRSIALPLLAAAGLALLGTVIVSRLLLVLAGLVGLGTVVTWMVQSLADEVSFGDIEVGAWLAVGGGVFAFVAAAARGRRVRARRAERRAATAA
jgi:hypothetical protein